tara:strand:- start:9 stop:1277 length:1269 start_codon:yes stop_codon:yes gene_type:complete
LNKLKFIFLFLLLFFLISLIIYYYYFFSPNKEKVLVINQVSYASLDSWTNDNHLKAFITFKISCKKLITLNPNKNMGAITYVNNKEFPFAGTIKDWIKPCKEAIKTELYDNKEAMLYFQKWFLPFSISYSHFGNFFSKGDDLGLFTGYYEPVIEGSTIFTKDYIFPIYSYPNNYITIHLGEFKKSLEGTYITGQIKNKKFIPTHKRSEIDKGAISSNSKVLYWLKDDVEVFFLHIQGSGVIKLPNGTENRVSYDGSNGHDYFAIGRELIKKGYISKDEMSMQQIKLWLKNNPEKKDKILQLNNRYIFFKKSLTNSATGAQNTPLVGGRSLAVDLKWIPLGIPLWLDIDNYGNENKLIIKKLMISQDTGSAIKGIIRGDIFFGTGNKPGTLAGKMNQLGKYYALLPRELVLRRNLENINEEKN